MTYEEWTAKNEEVRNAVACPKCKVAAGEECAWGSTHSGNASHSPRYAKFAKLAAKA